MLIDLTVLNLFEEYWDAVIIDSFTISLFAAILLQLMLKLTMAIEHRVAARFKDTAGAGAKTKRVLSTWIILFASKFAILGALDLAFGDQVLFTGALHGIITLIVVLVTMLAAEAVVGRITRSLGVAD